MVEGHHQFNGYVFEQTQEIVGMGSQACHSPWHGKESDMTKQQVQVDV